MKPRNAVNRFEIPTTGFERAKICYDLIFSYRVTESMTGSNRMGFILNDLMAGKGVGTIIHDPGFYSPGNKGSLICLDCQPGLQPQPGKPENAVGSILAKKHSLKPSWIIQPSSVQTRKANVQHCVQ